MSNVIVVPETEGFEHDVSHRNLVWITTSLGKPKVEEREVNYLAPFWLGENEGVNRIYDIRDLRDSRGVTEFHLGNSFVLENNWTNLGQRRRFEYHPLSVFRFIEIRPGLLIEIPE